jgi:PAS domain S-box-containing protein
MDADFSRSLVASLPDAVVSIDRTSRIIGVNDAALRLFGFTREGMLGRMLTETIIPTELGGQHMRGMDRFLSTGIGPVIGKRIDITACDSSGRRFPIELAVFLDSERPREVFHASIRDATDRVAREAVSSAERERLRQILDATADAWWDCFVGGETRYSDTVAVILSCPLESIPRTDPASLSTIHPEDRGRVLDAWRAHLDGQSGRFECTHRIQRADGSIRWVRQRGRAVEFELGRPTRIVGSLADVTEQQAADDRLRNAQRLEMLGLLAGGFAHDLNNMLAAIRGHAALAATEPGASPAALESLSSIQLATTKAKMLAANMMSLGKPTEEHVSRCDVREAVTEVLEIIRPNLPRTISVSTDLSTVGELELELDRNAFQQALLNLLLNARDAMPAGGRLRVEAVPLHVPELGACVRISVEDSGVGIPAANLQRLFEPFFTTKPQGVGTGLGLAVVQRAVARAGGKVDVTSELNRGSRFSLTLPAFAATRPATAADAHDEGRARQTVLLAESHAVLRPMLAEALRAAGYTVIEADGMAQASRIALERVPARDLEPISVLVAELGGGESSGSQLHGQIESILGTRIAAVLMASDPSSALPAGSRSDMRLLVKPFDIGELVAAVDSVR